MKKQDIIDLIWFIVFVMVVLICGFFLGLYTAKHKETAYTPPEDSDLMQEIIHNMRYLEFRGYTNIKVSGQRFVAQNFKTDPDGAWIASFAPQVIEIGSLKAGESKQVSFPNKGEWDFAWPTK